MSAGEVAPAVAPAPSIWSSIRRDVGLLAAGNAAVLAGQLVFRTILIAALAPAGYGRLSLLLSIYNTIWIVGASGVPSAVARHVAMIAPADDSEVLRSSIRAASGPAAIAAVAVAIAAGLMLHSLIAGALAAVGLVALVYTLLTMGILRGRGEIGRSASIMPVTALAELAPLALLFAVGVRITPANAFAVFCLGNVVGLALGWHFTIRTTPARARADGDDRAPAPSARQLLGFSMWLATATLCVSALPLLVRSAAAFDSYAMVATVDIAILLLALPQRLGTVLLFAVVPHAARAIERGERSRAVSLREHLIVVPFVVLAVLLLATPVVGWTFRSLGRPAYAGAGSYLALAVLAGPARILYGLVEGLLIARGDGRFLALNALSITLVAAVAMFAAVALGSTLGAFVVFVAACWAIYLAGLRRTLRWSASA